MCSRAQTPGWFFLLSMLAVLSCVKTEKVEEASSGTSVAIAPRTAQGETAALPVPDPGPQIAVPQVVVKKEPPREEIALDDSPALSELRDILVVPVQGIARDALHDTFEEARGTRRHDALDILAPRGTPVVSATDGKLLKLFQSKAGGLMIYASDPSSRFILMYAHLDSYAIGLAQGAALTKGQVIGYVGTTGNAPANTPHLHFAIARSINISKWWQGIPVNPYPLLAK